jgi:hypothetical protein
MTKDNTNKIKALLKNVSPQDLANDLTKQHYAKT